jgi:hypothetical protein
MKKLVPVLAAVMFFWSCKKSGTFPSTPQITLESVGPTLLHLGDSMTIFLSFRDGQADILDSVFFREDNTTRYNGFLSKAIPSFPTKTNEQGDLIITLNYITDIGQPTNPNGDPDTSAFTIFIKDQGGISSDTIQTPPIIIYPN